MSSSAHHERQPAQTAERALEVLGLFSATVPTLRIGEVADALGVHRSTASRLVGALVRHRLLERTPDGRAYALGLGLVSLAGLALDRVPVHGAAGDVVRDLREQTGEAVWVGVVDGDEVLYVHQATSPRMRVNVDLVGRRQPLAASLVGAVLLAHQPPEAIDGLLAEARAARAAAGPDAGGVELSEAELSEVRRVGHLARYRDPSSGHAVVCAPIRDHREVVVAALALSAVPHHVTEERFAQEMVPLTRDAAARVSERLGAPPTGP